MPRRPLTVIGIDPSASAGGYCVDLGDGVVIGHSPIDEIALLPWAAWDADRVVVCVECPSRMYRGSNHVVRSAANLWLARIKSSYPRRVTIIASHSNKFTDPDVWRGQVLVNVPGADWKAKAVWYVQRTLPHVTDHNEAEAFCIMQYARNVFRIRSAAQNNPRRETTRRSKQP